MSGSFPQRGPIGPTEVAFRDLTVRTNYTATHRAIDVASAAVAVDLYVGNPADSDTDLLCSVGFGAGGAAHLDTGENASITTSGTALTRQARGSNGTGVATIEQGGDYSSENPLETIITGSRRGPQPAAANGSDEPPDVRLLEPGDAVQYTATNRSGNTVDFDAVVTISEVDT